MDEPFYYTIDALRVDGDKSADPADYVDWPKDAPVGSALHGFLRAHLAPDLAPPGYAPQPRPGVRRQPMTWPVEHGMVLALDPTRADLERWSRVGAVALTCGYVTAVQEIPQGSTSTMVPFDLSAALDAAEAQQDPPPRRRRSSGPIGERWLLAVLDREEARKD